MVQPLDVLDKIGNFIEKYTGSNYGYTEPSGEINDNYQQIGEVFGFPAWMDDNRRYENEFLDFPTLADILNSVANSKIGFEIKKGDCSICLVINYSIPLVTYPPIVICLAKPDCKKKEEDKKPLGCRPINWNTGMPEGIDTSRPTDWREPPENIPPCNPTDDPGGGFLNPPPKDSDVYVKVTVWANGFRLYWGIQQTKYPYLGGYVDTQVSYSYDPPGKFKVGEFHVTSPVQITKTQTSGPSGYQGQAFINGQLIGNYHGGTTSSRAGDLDGPPEYMRSASFSMSYSLFTYAFEYEGEPAPPPNPDPNPDPNPIPDPTLPMNNQCCDDIKKILARIERDLKDIHRVINPKQWQKKECTVPASFIYPTGETHNIVLEDLPDYLGAIVRTIDRKGGALPQIVNVRDADPEIEGDQGIQIVVNSIADLCKLILEYLIQTQGNVGAIQMMQVANLYESAFTHQISAAAERKIQAICEFLDFEAKDVKTILKMAFNPTVTVDSKDDLQKLLPKLIKPHEQPLEEYQWAGGESLKDMIMDIRKKATFAAAGATETRDPDAVIDQFLQLERVKRLLQVREIDERLGIKRLKDFFDESEAGYPDSNLDRTFKQRPYGFEPVNKPKFKKATKGSKKRRYIKEKPPN